MRTRNGAPWTTLEPTFFWGFTYTVTSRANFFSATWEISIENSKGWRRWQHVSKFIWQLRWKLTKIVLFLFRRGEGNRLWMMQSLELGERRRKSLSWRVEFNFIQSLFERDVMGSAIGHRELWAHGKPRNWGVDWLKRGFEICLEFDTRLILDVLDGMLKFKWQSWK